MKQYSKIKFYEYVYYILTEINPDKRSFLGRIQTMQLRLLLQNLTFMLKTSDPPLRSQNIWIIQTAMIPLTCNITNGGISPFPKKIFQIICRIGKALNLLPLLRQLLRQLLPYYASQLGQIELTLSDGLDEGHICFHSPDSDFSTKKHLY